MANKNCGIKADMADMAEKEPMKMKKMGKGMQTKAKGKAGKVAMPK